MLTDRQSISGMQLFAMMMLFEFGTSLVIPIGFQSGQGVWLSILCAIPGGVLLFLVYHYLFRQYPKLILSGYFRVLFGHAAGIALGLIYAVYFIYVSARNLREAGDLLISSSYDRTPNLVIHSTIILAVIYVLHKGVEVFFRLGQIYFFIIILIGLVGNMLVLCSGLVEPVNLLPLNEEGWRILIPTAYPSIFMFPFGEIVCFLTLFPHMNNHRVVKNNGIYAILISGLLLSMTHAMEIAVLGPDLYSRSTFPLLTTLSMINIKNFIQRMDALVMITLIICVFFKMTMYGYAAQAIIADVFKVKDPRTMAYPVGALILLASLLSAWSLPEHNEEGITDVNLMKPVFCLLIPVLLLAAHLIRKKWNGRNGSPDAG